MDFSWQKLLQGTCTTIGAILTGGVGAAVPAVLSAVAGILGVDDPKDDAAMAQALAQATPEQRLALIKLDQDYKLEVERLAMQREQNQLAVVTASDANQTSLMLEDAKSTEKFRSWGRPTALWICDAALLFSFVIIPVARLVLAITRPEINVPPYDTGELLTMLGGLLGLSGLRTVERIKSKA